jgi:hypothetical protein
MVVYFSDIIYNRYREIFSEFDRQSDTPSMKAKIKNAKIINLSILIVDIILIIIVGYCNQHK